MVHWADNYATVGRFRIKSTSMTETQMKSAVKTLAESGVQDQQPGIVRLQHRQERHGDEAAMELLQHLDETGLHKVYTNCT